MRSTKSARIIVALTVLLALTVGAGVAAANEEKTDKEKKKTIKKNKVTICHIPPGNPSNAHLITVSINALDAHLAHGDVAAKFCLAKKR